MSMPKSKPKQSPSMVEIKEHDVREYMIMGFTEYEARRLNDARHDTRKVKKIISEGCSVKTAFRIFRP